MNVTTLPVGLIGTHCYLVSRTDRDDCVIIDPGAEPRKILSALDGKKPAAILLTHGHFDHIGAVSALMEVCPRLFIHPLDVPMLSDPTLNAGLPLLRTSVTAPQPTDLVSDGQLFTVAGLDVRVMHTPGHTPGGVCYVIGDCLFTGDTMFQHGWGRTDLPGGDEAALYASLRRLLPLREKYRVFPGHEG